MDSERLLESQAIGDNVIAVLARLRDARDAVRRIVASCSELSAPERAEALERLFVLAGLRQMEVLVEDLGADKVLGPVYRKGLDEGMQQGEILVLRRLVAKRFGLLPEWADQRLAGMTTQQLEGLSERVLDAASLEDLLS